MSEIRALDDLGTEFDRIIELRFSRRKVARPRLGVVLGALALAAGTGAAAAGLLPIGAAVTGPPKAEVPPALSPVAGSARVSDARMPDPFGGDPWAVRLATTRTGGHCAAVGRLRERAFGALTSDGTFRPLPLLGTGTCGDLTAEPVVVDIAVTRTPRGVETAVGGITRGQIAELTVRVGTRLVKGAHAGPTFLAVVRGDKARLLRAEARLVDGTRVTLYQGK